MNNIKYFDPEVLCETEWVANNLDNPEIKILEVDYDVENAYKSGHIQGAHMVWWKKDINDQTRRDIINKKQFESLMSRIGVSKSDTLILYGDFNNWFAAFAFWVFQYYGHKKIEIILLKNLLYCLQIMFPILRMKEYAHTYLMLEDRLKKSKQCLLMYVLQKNLMAKYLLHQSIQWSMLKEAVTFPELKTFHGFKR